MGVRYSNAPEDHSSNVRGTYVARAIEQYRPSPGIGEGVETGWRAPLVGEGTVRLSSKGESDRITQRSAVQIRPPQPWTPLPKCRGVRPFNLASFRRLSDESGCTPDCAMLTSFAVMYRRSSSCRPF